MVRKMFGKDMFLDKWNIWMDTVFEVDDVTFINFTPHELRLDDGRIIAAAPEAQAKLLAATVEEKIIPEHETMVHPKGLNPDAKIELVTTIFKPSDIGNEVVDDALRAGVWLVGSIISAKAFAGTCVVSPIVTPETARKPPQERIVFSRKWNYFLAQE